MRYVGRLLLVTLVQGILFLSLSCSLPCWHERDTRCSADFPSRSPAAPRGPFLRHPRQGPRLDHGDHPAFPDRGPLRRHAAWSSAERPPGGAVLYRVPGYLLVRGAVGKLPGLEQGKCGRNLRWWRPMTAGRLPCWSSGSPRASGPSSWPTCPRPRAGPFALSRPRG